MSEQPGNTKLWQKQSGLHPKVEAFTIGNDAEHDLKLARYDVLGSIAHAIMLGEIGILDRQEVRQLRDELARIHTVIEKGEFAIEEGVEDVHSQIEIMLTRALGDTGKKIHTARSRNDQVLVDLKLYLRAEIREMIRGMEQIIDTFLELSERYKEVLMPGYTHMQVAMPSSFGLWFGAYAESLTDDLLSAEAAFRYANRNPLGSAAGYGSSFPVDRQLTSDLLGFDGPHVNVVNTQLSRGKSEQLTAQAMANAASTLGKMAMDVCQFMSQNFGFMSFPEQLTTGSSIMPHKRNPDVFELLRGRCNRIRSLPTAISMLLTNLPSGYHRELQLMKEELFPAIESLKECLDIVPFMFDHVEIRENILDDPVYNNIYSVEKVNELVRGGMAFRDAYQEVARMIANGEFIPDREAPLSHSHLGSIGNPGTEQIRERCKRLIGQFEFEKIERYERELLEQ